MAVRIIRRGKKLKRITKQARISVYIHQKLLRKAREENRTLAKTLEKICLWYFNNEIQ